jgi:hypothetical protein
MPFVAKGRHAPCFRFSVGVPAIILLDSKARIVFGHLVMRMRKLVVPSFTWLARRRNIDCATIIGLTMRATSFATIRHITKLPSTFFICCVTPFGGREQQGRNQKICVQSEMSLVAKGRRTMQRNNFPRGRDTFRSCGRENAEIVRPIVDMFFR